MGERSVLTEGEKVDRYLPGYRLVADCGGNVIEAMKTNGVAWANLKTETFFCTDEGPAIPCRIDDRGNVIALDDGRILD